MAHPNARPAPTGLSRRRLLAGGGLGAAAMLTGCGSGSSAGGRPSAAGSGGGLAWWDQFLPLAELQQQTFEKFAADGGPPVNYTTYNPDKQGQALQLAFQSNQMPDVFTLAGVNTPPSSLQQAEWFQPVVDSDPITSGLPDGSIVDGLHSFDGKLYSWPQTSFRQYDTLPWANRELLAEAGIEPGTDPVSWDDFRADVRAAQDKTGKAGLILPLKFKPRMATFTEHLAQTAGFPGMDGIELATGAYHYHHDAYVQAIEFLRSFQTDQLLLPGSSTLDARSGRTRWAAGEAVYFFDGPYNAGVANTDFPEFLDKMAVGQIPTPDGAAPVITSGPRGGTYWIAAGSGQAEQVRQLFELFVSPQYRTGQAEAMDGAPIELEPVADSNAHDTFKQCCAWYAEHGFLGPTAVAGNPAVAEVIAGTDPVQPDLGAIVQGVLSGDVDDVRGTLKTYSEALTKGRDAAIKANGGGEVSVDDWAFGDWEHGVDYAIS